MLNKKIFKFFPRELIRYIDNYIPYKKCIICNKVIIKYSNQYYICSFYCYSKLFIYKFIFYSGNVCLIFYHSIYVSTVYLCYIFSLIYTIFRIFSYLISIYCYFVICFVYSRFLYYSKIISAA